ncbi:hypothetical protein [Archaeoglobus neptunius]|uniref:hypothetical protein n=1 Tax=Archaeoglobus neptunius TaxID=2798580 RepID=UPI0019251FB8|nr:hypothetical protein [Archaeoglobus neptunius]
MKRDEFVRKLYFASNPTIILAQSMEVPHSLAEKVKLHRLNILARELAGEDVPEEEKVSDAEVVAFLHSASLMVPLDETFANIFVNLTQKVLGVRVRELEYRELTEQEKFELKQLKREILKRRERREKERAKQLRETFREIAKKLPKKIDVRQSTLEVVA